MNSAHSTGSAGPPRGPRTPRYDIDALKASVDLEELTRSFSDGEGRHDQQNAWFRCPLPEHEDRNPSFSVNRRNGSSWRCWSCGASGSGIFDLVMAVHRLEFIDAVKWVGERYGGTDALPPLPTTNQRTPVKPRNVPVDKPVTESFFAAERVEFPRGGEYREHLLKSRRWSDEAAPGKSVFRQFGIELVKDRGALWWRFPFVYRGEAVYWQDRATSRNTTPKWNNPAGTCPVPYNVDRMAGDSPFIVALEGPADVVTFSELNMAAIALGFPGANAVKRRWLDGLREDGRPVLVLSDNDNAGEAMRTKFTDELGDQVRHVYVPDGHGDLTDWWVAVGADNPEERERLMKDIRTKGES